MYVRCFAWLLLLARLSAVGHRLQLAMRYVLCHLSLGCCLHACVIRGRERLTHVCSLSCVSLTRVRRVDCLETQTRASSAARSVALRTSSTSRSAVSAARR